MNRQDIYKNYLLKIKEILDKDDFDSLDYILEYMYSNVSDKEREPIEEILNETTLYFELKEKEYKDTALSLINSFAKI